MKIRGVLKYIHRDNYFLKVIFAVMLFSVLPNLGFGQTHKSVQSEIKEAEAEIARINKLVGVTRKEQGVTLGHLKLVVTKLENRQKIVKVIKSEIGTVSGQLQAKTTQVTKLEKRHGELTRSYSALIRIAYKNHRNNSFLSFILSASDFTDAARRLYYVKRIVENIHEKAEEMERLSDQLGVETSTLNSRKGELDGLQQQHDLERVKLEKEQIELKKTQGSLKGKEKKLLAEAEKRRRRVVELEQQLQKAVNEEVRKNRGRDKRATGSSVSQSQLTAKFVARKGTLLRPVEGVVVDRYGLHNHPTQKGIKINNKGINIATKAGGEVLCVFGGEVRKVFFFHGLGNSIMVRHGEYLTIYANLEDVFVREGEQLSEGQSMGSVAKAPSGQQATLHFELWKESDNMNPELWIKR